jgi:hypothetical protein
MSKITILNRTDGKSNFENKAKSEVRFVPAKCMIKRGAFLIKLMVTDESWIIEDAFLDGSAVGMSSEYETTLFSLGKQFDASKFTCPLCNAKTFTQCGSCDRLTCWDGREVAECAYCGISGKPSGRMGYIGVVTGGKSK